MYSKIVHLIPWFKYLKILDLSEREAAGKAGLSRSTWRKIVKGDGNIELASLAQAGLAMGLEISVLAAPEKLFQELSTIAVSYKVMRDGPPSWKIHYMELVDEFRRQPDPRLILLPPPADLPLHLGALLAAIVVSLCSEIQMDAPEWARRRIDLPQPWFVSETESLKASALLESPLPFRRNGIFVTSNFMERA